MKKLPIGISDFKEIRIQNYYFVDKSLFIKEIIEENAEVILLPRPRRFGKTLNLSILKYFFEKSHHKQKIKSLFQGLKIEKEDIFQTHCCMYPVIYLTFKDVKHIHFKDAINAILLLISDEFKRHKYLLESKALDRIEKEKFNNIMLSKATISVFENSLKDLSTYLSKHYNQKALLLIDEYDTPIHTAYYENYYNEIIAFFRSFLGAGLKDNPNIFKGVLTGILRVAKESIFSGLNNLAVYSIVRSEYSDKFGFTENEVNGILKNNDIEEKLEIIKKWYNGYTFGNNIIYNPWSILNFAASADKEPRSYWANTASNEIIKDAISQSPQIVKAEFQDLLQDRPIIKRLNENIVFADLIKDDITLYSFLLFSGYLNAFSKKNVDEEQHYNLQIPNKEVKQIFKHVIIKWINEPYGSYKLQMMLNALLENETETFEEILNDFVIETLSYFDTQKKDVERVYQAFILGLLVNLSPHYEINSNKESGFGRYDISIIPNDRKKNAIIMELKKIGLNETKDTALANALKQIEEKKYETEIIKRGFKDIIKLAVTFDGKRVWVTSG